MGDIFEEGYNPVQVMHTSDTAKFYMAIRYWPWGYISEAEKVKNALEQDPNIAGLF